MNCPYCNNPLPQQAQKCPVCGVNITPPPPPPPPPYPQQQQQQQQPPPTVTPVQPIYQQQQYQQQQYQQQYQQQPYQQPYQQQYQQQQYQRQYQVESVSMVTALKKYAQFSGRSRRSEYWLFVLFQILIGIALGFWMAFMPEIEFVRIIVDIAFFIPGIAVFVRRMHDTGRSGWNWLWYLLPIIGWIIVLIYLCSDSQPGTNQYGDNPKGF